LRRLRLTQNVIKDNTNYKTQKHTENYANLRKVYKVKKDNGGRRNFYTDYKYTAEG